MNNSRKSIGFDNPDGKVFFAFGTLYPHLTGGMEVFNFHFLKYLLEEKKQDLFYFSDHALENHEKQLVSFRHSRPFRITYPLQFFWQLYKRRKKISCVVTNFSEQSWVIPFLQYVSLKLLNIPYHVVIHWGSLPASGPEWPLRIFFSNALSVITVSEHIKKEYTGKYRKGNFMYIPPLIPFEHSIQNKEELKGHWGLEEQAKVVLFVGSLKNMKNPGDLLQAAILMGPEKLKQQKLHFIFAGSGQLKDALKEKSMQEGIQQHVHFTGLVSRELIPGLYKIADVFVMPSDYEGTPLALLEAFSNGVPVVASAVPGILNLIKNGQNGLLFPVKRPEILCSHLLKLIEDPDEAARMGNAGLEVYRKQFSYENMIAAYEKLLTLHPKGARIVDIGHIKNKKVKPLY